MANWLTGAQRRSEAETVPGLVEDTEDLPATPDTTLSLDDGIPDIGDCVECRRPVTGGGNGTFTCGHRMHDECLRAHRD
eukprot:9384089-Alexandrium_andersonii.AAC.1